MNPGTVIAALLALLCLGACSAGAGGGAPPPAPPAIPIPAATDPAPAGADAVVAIDDSPAALAAAPPVNRRVLGSNLQWTDGCDGLLAAGGTAYAPSPLAAAVALAPTVLRYPGGGHADLFRWDQGEGASRGTSTHAFTQAAQTVWFGTGEFLDLCRRTGAGPMITLNTVTGSATESAAWVMRANGADRSGAPVVRDWEVGNEPYLENAGHPELDRTAAQYAAAYDAHAAAVLAADARLRLGLPLMGPLLRPLVAAARRGWNAEVLSAIRQRVDFVAVHDAYLPFYHPHDRVPADGELLPALLASAAAVDADLDLLRAELTAAGCTAPFAMTEFNALGTTFATFAPIPRSDGLPVSVAGAVYLADLVCTLARRDDVDSALHWSLVGNWCFGAFHPDGSPRPALRALHGLSAALTGRRLPVAVAAPLVAVPAFGAKPAQAAVPLVSAFAAGGSGGWRAVLVNRSPDRALSVRIDRAGGRLPMGARAGLRVLSAADPLQEHYLGATTPDWSASITVAGPGGLVVALPACSLAIVELPPPPDPMPDMPAALALGGGGGHQPRRRADGARPRWRRQQRAR